MNTQNFLQSGGFPIETETLHELQKAFLLFNFFGDLAGNFSIISGCIVTGTTVSNGAVFINGELLNFKGGTIATNVVIIQTVKTNEFEDGTEKEVLYTRYATFGIDTVSFAWANFKRCFQTNQIQTALNLKEDKTTIQLLTDRIVTLEGRPNANVPLGMIAIWDRPASEIPVGWVEYVPLRGRMPVGHNSSYAQGTDLVNYGLENLGNSGGLREHKLTKAELPNYNLTRTVGIETPAGGNNNIWSNAPGNAFTEIINSGGGDLAHTNMSPFRVVHFIKYIGQ